MILKVQKRVAEDPDTDVDSWVYFEADEIHVAGRPEKFIQAKMNLEDPGDSIQQYTEIVYNHNPETKVLVVMLRGHGDQLPRYVIFDQTAYLMNSRGDTIEKFKVKDFVVMPTAKTDVNIA